MKTQFFRNENGRALEAALGAHGVPAAVAEALAVHHTPLHYRKGATVFRQGSPADLIFWVVAGLVKVYCPNSDGSRFMIQLAAPGDLVGYVNVTKGEGREVQAFEAQALGECWLSFVARDHVIRAIQALEANVLAQVVKTLNDEWCGMFRELARFCGLSLQDRMDLVLTNLGERLGASDARGVLLIPAFSHMELAEMIGSSRPMASRLISKMVREGTLTKEGRHYILSCRSKIAQSIASRRKSPTAEAEANVFLRKQLAAVVPDPRGRPAKANSRRDRDEAPSVGKVPGPASRSGPEPEAILDESDDAAGGRR